MNLTGDATDSSQAQKRRNIITDLLIGLGIPLLAIALCKSTGLSFSSSIYLRCLAVWFYQGHRFDILEGIGCVEAYPNTFLSILLNTVWPVPIGLVSAVYAVLAVRGTTRDLRRLQAVETGGLTSYYRLMVLAAANVLFITPLSSTWLLSTYVSACIRTGFAYLHSGFGRVVSVTAVIWRQSLSAAVVTLRNFRTWTLIP